MRSPFAVGLALVTVIGCSTPSQPDANAANQLPADFNRALSSGPVAFALTSVEQQRSDPIVTFDHMCQGVRLMMLVSDTITLFPDGTARRVFHLDRSADGQMVKGEPMVALGRWQALAKTNYAYFSEGPSISVSLATESGSSKLPPYDMLMRVRGVEALSTLSALGGSCPGSPNDGHNAEFSYSRQE